MSEQSPIEFSIDRALRAADATLRRSHHVLRSLNNIISSQQVTLEAADETIARADQALSDVVIDLAALERSGERALGSQVRVLVVDDNAVIRRTLEVLFDLEFGDDVDVRSADGGLAALALVEWRPDVIVLDWQMPDVDGLETARRLRPLLMGTRIVMYSSRSAADGVDAALAAGADAYVEKGADTAGLLDEVDAVIIGRQPPPSLAGTRASTAASADSRRPLELIGARTVV